MEEARGILNPLFCRPLSVIKNELGVLECLKGRAEKVNDFDLISSVMSFVSRPLLWADVSLQVCKAWASKKQDKNEFFPVKDLQTASLQIKQKKWRENMAAWESDEMMEIAPGRAPTSNWPRNICAQKW